MAQCQKSAVRYGNMYECVDVCEDKYLYVISLANTNITVCVQQCPADSPLLDAEVSDGTSPLKCIPNCKAVGKYMYKADSFYYCVADCSFYNQYHSAVGSSSEAKCMSQCPYLTYVQGRTHCIDVCNYIVEYPNIDA